MIYRQFWGVPTREARNPFSELDRVRRQMERLFEGLGSSYPRPGGAGVFPLINLSETKDGYFIRAELPGVTADQLDIQVTGNSVSIAGERRIPQENKEARYHRREREAGRFSRVVGLPTEIDAQKVDAALVNGVLTVAVSKAETAKPRQVTVK
jgi:HSP20 family protein